MKAKKWGRIVTIGSVNQYNNHPELSLYGMTKAALMKMVENTASGLAPYGVTINNIAPGAIATPRNEATLSDKATYEKVIAKIPAGFVGEPYDIAPAVLLMCSEEGRYITGSELIIDGGMHL
jgi:NAD(P)-dependent dehydrogenase (short-subunit alcohol dehydrogenase family)